MVISCGEEKMSENKLENLKKKVFSCSRCELHKTKIKYVFGEGSVTSPIIFIGEAPGANEDKSGRPFVGRAGQVFNDLLKSVELHREGIYIANILKCRPPNNRSPSKHEINMCTLYLRKQIEIISPKVICPMGNFATDFILDMYAVKKKFNGISKLHGHEFKIRNLNGILSILPLYHPAVATYNPPMKKILIKDIKKVKKLI